MLYVLRLIILRSGLVNYKSGEGGVADMLFFRSFINLFFVPVVALYIFYKNNNLKLDASFDTLIKYCIIAACNIPITRLITMICRIMLDKNIEVQDSYYTVAALIAAYFLPFLYSFFCKIKNNIDEDDELEKQKNQEKKGA